MPMFLIVALLVAGQDAACVRPTHALPNSIDCQLRVVYHKAGVIKQDAGQIIVSRTLSTFAGRPIHYTAAIRLAEQPYDCVVSLLPVRAPDGKHRISIHTCITNAAGAPAPVDEDRTLRLTSGEAGTLVLRDRQHGGELAIEVRLRSHALVDRWPDLVPTLVGALASRDDRVRLNAAATLDALGSDAIPGLLRGLERADQAARPLAARLIGRILAREPWHRDDVVGPLTQAARSDDEALRYEAIVALRSAIAGSPRGQR